MAFGSARSGHVGSESNSTQVGPLFVLSDTTCFQGRHLFLRMDSSESVLGNIGIAFDNPHVR